MSLLWLLDDALVAAWLSVTAELRPRLSVTLNLYPEADVLTADEKSTQWLYVTVTNHTSASDTTGTLQAGATVKADLFTPAGFVAGTPVTGHANITVEDLGAGGYGIGITWANTVQNGRKYLLRLTVTYGDATRITVDEVTVERPTAAAA